MRNWKAVLVMELIDKLKSLKDMIQVEGSTLKLAGYVFPALFKRHEDTLKHWDWTLFWGMNYIKWRRAFPYNKEIYVSPFASKGYYIKTDVMRAIEGFTDLSHMDDFEEVFGMIGMLALMGTEPVQLDHKDYEWLNPEINLIRDLEEVSIYDEASEWGASYVVETIVLDFPTSDARFFLPMKAKGGYCLGMVEIEPSHLLVGDSLKIKFDKVYHKESLDFVNDHLFRVSGAKKFYHPRMHQYISDRIFLEELHSERVKRIEGKIIFDKSSVDLVKDGMEYEVKLPFDLTLVPTRCASVINKLFSGILIERIEKFPASVVVVDGELRFMTSRNIDMDLANMKQEFLYFDYETLELLGDNVQHLTHLNKLLNVLSSGKETLRTNLGNGLVNLDGSLRGNLFAKYGRFTTSRSFT